jgi:hypothetical protein
VTSAEGTEMKKARYEGSPLQALMEASGHVICDRCFCCDAVYERVSCWQCGGFADTDFEDEPECSVCHDEGELSYLMCLGRCDDDGNHAAKS